MVTDPDGGPETVETDAENLRASLAAAFDAPETETPSPEKPEVLPALPARDETGKFVAKPTEPAKPEPAPEIPAKPEAGKVDASAPLATPQLSPASPAIAPPPGWSVVAKAEWEKLPAPVREAVAKRETEISAGLAELGEWKPLKPYSELAKQSGTTLSQALDRYIAYERAIMAKPVEAVLGIIRDFNIDPTQIAAALGAPAATPKPSDPQPQPQPQPPPRPDPALAELKTIVTQLASTINGQTQASVQSELTAFQNAVENGKPKHPFFDNVKITMGRLMQTGEATSLEDAYDKACWANSEIRSALIKERDEAAKADAASVANDAASKARQASKSLNGAPHGQTVPKTERGLREELSAAWE